MRLEARKRGTALLLFGIVAGMLGLTAASVPLYRWFCQVTGYGGTTQRSGELAAAVRPELVRVAFNADVAPDLGWLFRPMQRRLEVHPGEQHLAFYEAVNRSDQPIVGMAVFNVTPHKVGLYFDKIACFCFEEQVLGPGERAELPVSFYVDPAMLDDPGTREVREITLSYTFFRDEAATAELRRQRQQEPAS